MPKVAKSEWTKEERELDRLAWLHSSRNPTIRFKARLALQAMEKRLGKEEMERMWERIK